MIVAYCKSCLPAKIVLGYSDRISEIRAPHGSHPQTKRNGFFPVSFKEWNSVFVEGNEPQTKANIAAQFQSRMI